MERNHDGGLAPRPRRRYGAVRGRVRGRPVANGQVILDLPAHLPLIVNLTEVSYIGSQGFRVFELLDRSRAHLRQRVVLVAPPVVRRIAELVGLGERFVLAGSLDEAARLAGG